MTTDNTKSRWEHVEDIKDGLSKAANAIDKLRNTSLTMDLLLAADYGRTRTVELLDELEAAVQKVRDARRQIADAERRKAEATP